MDSRKSKSPSPLQPKKDKITLNRFRVPSQGPERAKPLEPHDKLDSAQEATSGLSNTNRFQGHYEEAEALDDSHAIRFDQVDLFRGQNKYSSAKIDSQPERHAQNSITVTEALPRQKLKISTDEDHTKKMSVSNIGLKKEVEKEMKENQTEKKAIKERKKLDQDKDYSNIIDDSPFGNVEKGLKIPRSKKVEEILGSVPLRQKWLDLLDEDDKYELGYDHKVLLSLLRAIYEVITFDKLNKQMKNMFYIDLRRNIKNKCQRTLSLQNIGQIMFLDDNLLKVEWERRNKNRDQDYEYDLMIIIPKLVNFDPVIKSVKRKIIDYLLAMEHQFMEEKGIQKSTTYKWAQGFDPSTIQIRSKALPPKPDVAAASLGYMTRDEIDKIPNQHIKQLGHRKRDEVEEKSKVSDEIIATIFNKDGKSPNKPIYNILQEAIRKREQQIEERPKNLAPKIDKKILTDITNEIMLVYMTKQVSNMAKATLVTSLERSLKISIDLVTKAVDLILGVSQVRYLSEHITSTKLVILKLDKTKLKPMLRHIEDLTL